MYLCHSIKVYFTLYLVILFVETWRLDPTASVLLGEMEGTTASVLSRPAAWIGRSGTAVLTSATGLVSKLGIFQFTCGMISDVLQASGCCRVFSRELYAIDLSKKFS